MRVTENTFVLSGGWFSAGDYRAQGAIYGFRTPEGLVLVDCGLPDDGMVILNESLAYEGITEKVTHVLVTHSHVDHCGNAKYFQDRGAKIIVGKPDLDNCLKGGFNMFRDTQYDEGFYHYFPAFTPDVLIEKDCEMTINGIRFEFIMIPGHTPGSLAIIADFEGKRMMFTGDSIYPMGELCEKVSLGWHGDPNYSASDFVQSMIKLVKYDVDMILPGHGNICVRNGTNVLRHAAKEAFTTLR